MSSDDINKTDEKKDAALPDDIGKYLDELSSNPKSKVFVKVAEEYRKVGLLDEALEICENGLKENPNYLSANLVLAKILFDKKEYERSFQETIKVTSAQSDNLMAQNLLLDLYIINGDKDSAIKVCEVISYLDPKNEEILKKKEELETVGIVKKEVIVDTEAASDDKEEELELEPEEEGIDDEEFVLEESDESEDITTNTLAELYIKQGFYDKGLNIYRELLKESPGEEKLIEKIKEIEGVIAEKGIDKIAEESVTEKEEKKVYELDIDVEETAKKESDKDNKIAKLNDWLLKVQKRGRR